LKTGSKAKAPKHANNGKAKLIPASPEGIPIAYDETKAKDRFWKSDAGDELLPKRKGLITDFVYKHRGKQVSTLFTIWSTLFLLSSAIKREAYLRFGEKKLYTNFYCILVGPAGIAHKTEAINDATEVLEHFGDYITDVNFKIMKGMNIVADKASPEALLESLHPRNKPPRDKQGFWFLDADGKQIINPNTGRPMWYSKTSETAIVAHEFSTLAGQQKYNTGLTDNLLALYECDRPFTWRTVKRGKPIVFRNLHTTLIAGTTLTAFRESLSENVRSAGFLSRSVMVYCPSTPGRRFSRPRIVPGAPDEKELSKRLAWIAEHCVGEFDLTPDADKYYDQWYCKFWDDLENDTQFQGLRSRMHVLVLKVALLLRAQRYEVGPRLIDKQDIKDAILIIKKTWFEALPVMRGFESRDAKPFLGRLEEYIRTRTEVDRNILFRGGKFTAIEIREGITMLCEEGKIEIWKGKELKQYPSADGKELYKWIGEKWLGEDGLDE
jgi:hypothetical protein